MIWLVRLAVVVAQQVQHAVRDGTRSADDTIREFKAITKYL